MLINTCSCIAWQVSSKCRPTGNNTYIHSCMYTLHQVKVLVQLLSKKRILGLILYIKFFLYLFLIQGPSKGSNSCNMIYIWFLFTPRKNLLNGENTKKCLLLLLLRSFKKYSETTASVVGVFFSLLFFSFSSSLVWKMVCTKSSLSLSFSFNFKTYLFFCPSHSSVMFK